MSNMLEKSQKNTRQEKNLLLQIRRQNLYFMFLLQPDGSTIQMDFRFTMDRYICFINIIHITGNGDQCTGGIALRAI